MTTMNLENVKNFIYAGNATLTISSSKTGVHYTFKISSSEKEGMFFVSLLSGPDYYQYLGIILRGNFKLTKASKLTLESKPVTAIRYLLWCINRGKDFPLGLEVRHEGKCGRCGRKLTTPESIDLGLGPVCLEKVGG
jgi:hypothetical protein